MKEPSISLCMIVKDEESNIANCLKSAQGIVDEIIIVDTGSTDETISICKMFNVKIFNFKWNNSFAEVRNFGLKQAKGDWILWLDADEEIDIVDGKNLKKCLSELKNEKLLSMHLINYIGNKKNINQTFQIAHTRLFKNHLGFKFKQNVHEILNVEEVLGEIHEIKMIPVKIYHYGYLNSEVLRKNKSVRNLNLLLEELKIENHSPWIEYHLASEYYRLENYIDSFEYVNKSIIGFINDKKLPPSLLYKLKYSILLCLGSIEGAWPSIDLTIKLYPDYVDLYFFKGIILFYKKRYKESLATFDQCIKMGDTNLKHLTLKGVGGHMALFYKGACLEKMGDLKNAKNAYELAVSLAPDYMPALEAKKKLNM